MQLKGKSFFPITHLFCCLVVRFGWVWQLSVKPPYPCSRRREKIPWVVHRHMASLQTLQINIGYWYMPRIFWLFDVTGGINRSLTLQCTFAQDTETVWLQKKRNSKANCRQLWTSVSAVDPLSREGLSICQCGAHLVFSWNLILNVYQMNGLWSQNRASPIDVLIFEAYSCNQMTETHSSTEIHSSTKWFVQCQERITCVCRKGTPHWMALIFCDNCSFTPPMASCYKKHF